MEAVFKAGFSENDVPKNVFPSTFGMDLKDVYVGNDVKD
ncbi:hypothetical protein B4U80_09660 [Leptotrombidium deliense]|uniref:Uncharacterized protein n=1 Tax=Leptotrombidium deliense TaxID=299467 RepID=A0A443S0K4_9ACAR|nr:hypothetical protein B4U80_09660 [Leptotrombidium deliense]